MSVQSKLFLKKTVPPKPQNVVHMEREKIDCHHMEDKLDKQKEFENPARIGPESAHIVLDAPATNRKSKSPEVYYTP